MRAKIEVVDSLDAAVASISRQTPDVILLTALLSPRHEDALVEHLRAREHVEHVQTHTIPMLASSGVEEGGGGGGLFGRLKRKKTAEAAAGCDPDVFAGQLREYLARATEIKHERESRRLAEAATAPPVD